MTGLGSDIINISARKDTSINTVIIVDYIKAQKAEANPQDYTTEATL
jgi:hypothetical protein